MKTNNIIDSWHPVHVEARRGPQFAELARDLRTSSVDGQSAQTARAIELLTKDTKSLAKQLQALEVVEERLAATINYQARKFDRTDIKLIRAERLAQ